MLKIEEIRTKALPVAKKYNVTHLEIFGSYANGAANQNSDVDFLVEFSVPIPSIFKVMGFREELERSLGVKVDVVTLPLTNPKRLFIDKRERIL